MNNILLNKALFLSFSCSIHKHGYRKYTNVWASICTLCKKIFQWFFLSKNKKIIIIKKKSSAFYNFGSMHLLIFWWGEELRLRLRLIINDNSKSLDEFNLLRFSSYSRVWEIFLRKQVCSCGLSVITLTIVYKSKKYIPHSNLNFIAVFLLLCFRFLAGQKFCHL